LQDGDFGIKTTNNTTPMKTLITCFSVLALAIGFANAEGKPGPRHGGKGGPGKGHPGPGEILKALDTDGNGAISLAEFKAGKRAQENPEKAAEIFAKLDADASGEITPAEFKAGHEAHAGKGGKCPQKAAE